MSMNFQPDAFQTMIVEAVNNTNPKAGIVCIAPVSCGAFICDGFDFDFCQSVPGCAPAVASGIKRVRPDALVFTYQNAVDIAAAGLSELIHAANRSENITIVYANNGGAGFDGENSGRIKLCELLSGVGNAAYVTRVAATEKDQTAAIKAIENAFKLQQEGKGFSFVEILSVSDDEDDPESKALLADLPVKTFKDNFGIEKA